MAISNAAFEFKTEKAQELFEQLNESLDGTENCVDDSMTGEHADLWMEAWTGRSIPKADAESLCRGCHVKELCAKYAMEQQETYGIWGGTRPVDRGISRKTKAW